MDTPRNSPDELIASFFSRNAQRELAAIIRNTYSVLIACARMASRISEDDLDFAQEYVDSNKNNDLSKACKLFDFVRLGHSDSGSRLHGPRVIMQVQSPELAGHLGKSEQDLQNLVGLFFEFRACCLALLQHRHLLAHDSESRISFTQAAFLASCVTRSFELSHIIHSVVQRQFSHLPTLNRYTTELRNAFGGSNDSQQVEQGKEDQVDGPLHTILLLREIVDDVKPLNDAMEAISEEHSKTFASLDEIIQSGHADLVTRISAIEERLSHNLVQADLSEPVQVQQIHGSTTKQEAPKLSKLQAEQALVSLRDQIFNRMLHEIDGFKHYHNVLQRPLINAALSAQCADLASFKRLKEFQMRMNRNPPHFADKQMELFGQQISELLERVDYAAKTQGNPDFEFDDLPPF